NWNMGKSYRRIGTARFKACKHLAKIFAVGAALFCSGVMTSGGQEENDFVPGQILVKAKPHMSETAVRRLFAAHGATQADAIRQIGVRIVHVAENRHAIVLEALKHNPNLEFAEPNYLLTPDAIPNDPYFSQEWHLTKIETPTAWDSTVGSGSVTIAI